MTRAILCFKLPQERNEHLAALHGLDFFLAVSAFDEWLRVEIKHGTQYDRAALQAARDCLREYLNGYGIDMEAFD